MRPNWSTAVRTAASASERLVTSSVTGNRSFGVPNAFDTASAFRPVATTAWPDASAAFAKSAPMPRPAPVMNHTFLLFTTSSCSPARTSPIRLWRRGVPSHIGNPFRELSPDHFQELLRIACAMKFDLRRRPIDLAKVLGGQMNVHGRDVLVEAMPLRRSRNRHDPGLLREQPGQRELRRSRSLPLGEGLEPLHEGQVGLAVLLGEPRHGIAEIARLERRLVVNRACQKALAERT